MAGAFVCAALGIRPTVATVIISAPGSRSFGRNNRAILRTASAASRAADHMLPSRAGCCDRRNLVSRGSR
nr:antirestriction protein ArdC [Novosphingobium sp. CECT 9465]